MLDFMSRGKLSCAVALLATAAFAGAAMAAPPSNVKVTESGGRITATWDEPGLFDVPFAAEVARSTRKNADGSFSDAGKIREPLDEIATSWTSPVLPNGTWYVHIGAYELGENCTVDDDGNLKCPTDWSPTVTVRVGPGTGPKVTDTVTEFKMLRVAARQKLAKLRVRAAMAERGTITVRGTINTPKAFKLKAVSVTALANKTLTIAVKLPKKALKAATRALKRGKKVRANLTIVAKDSAGNRKSEKRSVKLQR
jgi:hypothetical protein